MNQSDLLVTIFLESRGLRGEISLAIVRRVSLGRRSVSNGSGIPRWVHSSTWSIRCGGLTGLVLETGLYLVGLPAVPRPNRQRACRRRTGSCPVSAGDEASMA